MIRSGSCYVDSNTPDFRQMYTGSGDRIYNIYVKFKQPFDEIPQVEVALYTFEANNDHNTRIKCYAKDVTPLGFNICFETWGPSGLFSIGANWIAYNN